MSRDALEREVERWHRVEPETDVPHCLLIDGRDKREAPHRADRSGQLGGRKPPVTVRR